MNKPPNSAGPMSSSRRRVGSRVTSPGLTTASQVLLYDNIDGLVEPLSTNHGITKGEGVTAGDALSC